MAFWFQIGSLFKTKTDGVFMGKISCPEGATITIPGNATIAVSRRTTTNESGNGPFADLYLVPEQDEKDKDKARETGKGWQ